MPEEPIEDLDDLSGARMPEDAPVPNEEQPQQPGVVDRAQDLKDQFDQSKQLYQKGKEKLAARAEKSAAKKGLKEGVEKKGAEAARRKVATRATEEAGKQALKKGAVATGGKVVGGILAKQAVGSVVPVIGNIVMAIVSGLQLLWPTIKKAIPYVIYGVAGLLLLLAAAFGLLGGTGSPEYPSTEAHTAQAQTTAYLAGDVIAKKAVTQEIFNRQKQRYEIVLRHVKETMPEKTVEIQKAVNEINNLLESAIGLSGSQRDTVIKQVNEKIRALDSTLPYGEWVAKEAEKYVGPNPSASKDFCRITRNSSPGLGCASVVSVIMYDAGIPQDLTRSQQAIWHNFRLQLLVAPLPGNKLSRDLYAQNKDQLQRGDIVWWGNGKRRDGSDVGLQGHIGIYIGNGKAVANSTDSANKAGRAVPAISDVDRSKSPFNGAKRYGK